MTTAMFVYLKESNVKINFFNGHDSVPVWSVYWITIPFLSGWEMEGPS